MIDLRKIKEYGGQEALWVYWGKGVDISGNYIPGSGKK